MSVCFHLVLLHYHLKLKLKLILQEKRDRDQEDIEVIARGKFKDDGGDDDGSKVDDRGKGLANDVSDRRVVHLANFSLLAVLQLVPIE